MIKLPTSSVGFYLVNWGRAGQENRVVQTWNPDLALTLSMRSKSALGALISFEIGILNLIKG